MVTQMSDQLETLSVEFNSDTFKMLGDNVDWTPLSLKKQVFENLDEIYIDYVKKCIATRE